MIYSTKRTNGKTSILRISEPIHFFITDDTTSFPIEKNRKYNTIKNGTVIKTKCNLSADPLKRRNSTVRKAVQKTLLINSRFNPFPVFKALLKVVVFMIISVSVYYSILGIPEEECLIYSIFF